MGMHVDPKSCGSSHGASRRYLNIALYCTFFVFACHRVCLQYQTCACLGKVYTSVLIISDISLTRHFYVANGFGA
jgi:hypothetical protein